MIKIVYFDDASATDYLYIYDGGKKIKNSEKVKGKSSEIADEASAKLYSMFSWLPFTGGGFSNEVQAKIVGKSDSLIKTTLSNTVLTDFLEKVKKDERFEKFRGYRVSAHKNSMAYFKMFTPYFIMTNSKVNMGMDDVVLDISKMDAAFESGKGYYEMIAESSSKIVVFRFNIKAFRNNYGIADLTKMDLTYYGVKVGSVDIKMLEIDNEFINDESNEIMSAIDIEEGDTSSESLVVDVYDIVLAGVEI